MEITFDVSKRSKTLDERGLDFADAVEVFAGITLEFLDERFEYGEPRITTVGYLCGRMVVMIWTHRGKSRHIISLRKANEREKAKFRQRLEEG